MRAPSTKTHRRQASLALAAVGCAAALAACGGLSSKPTASAQKNAGLAFSDCMRSHGVTNFPDPSGGGGNFRIQIGPGTGINPQSPSFQAAQTACSKLMPGGGPGHGHPTEAARLALLHLAECMRAHGLSDFPDPTTTQPTPGPNGPGLVLGRDGVFLALPPGINPTSPNFEQAGAACGFPVPGKAKEAPAPG